MHNHYYSVGKIDVQSRLSLLYILSLQVISVYTSLCLILDHIANEAWLKVHNKRLFITYMASCYVATLCVDCVVLQQ